MLRIIGVCAYYCMYHARFAMSDVGESCSLSLFLSHSGEKGNREHELQPI